MNAEEMGVVVCTCNLSSWEVVVVGGGSDRPQQQNESEARLGLPETLSQKELGEGWHMETGTFDDSSLRAAKWMDLYPQHCPC